MWTALGTGVLLGLSSGLAPGPLLTLALAQTLRHGRREGCKIALAPLITDAPIIAVALAVAEGASRFDRALGILAIAGGSFVLYLAADTFRPVRWEAELPDVPPASWSKGVLTNLLNPHPWLFWTTVGAAILGRGMAVSWFAPAVFLAAFYTLLVGSKLVLVLAVDRWRQVLTGRWYRFVMRGLGVLLLVFGALMIREGLNYLAT